MAQKRVVVAGVGEVVLQKRRGARSLRLTVAHDGAVRVSMPFWTPYRVGEAFAASKSSWLQEQFKTRQVAILKHGDRIGKAHTLRFIPENRSDIRTRVLKSDIIIRLPNVVESTSEATQAAAKKAAVRALRQQASQLLPKRLHDLAEQHDFTYRSVRIRPLKSRWGSCSSEQDIVLNCYLMQLPWELIDYVLLHELTHTQVLAHGSAFWAAMARVTPHLSERRKAIKSYQPTLLASAAVTM